MQGITQINTDPEDIFTNNHSLMAIFNISTEVGLEFGKRMTIVERRVYLQV